MSAAYRQHIYPWGVFIILICTLLLYEVFLYDKILDARWDNAQFSAQVAVNDLKIKMDLGLRLGMPLERYARLLPSLREVSDIAAMPMAIGNAEGKIVQATMDFPPHSLQATRPEHNALAVVDVENGRLVLLPLAGRGGVKRVGYVAAFINRGTLETSARQTCLRYACIHAFVMLGGIAVLIFLIQKKHLLGTSRKFVLCISFSVLVSCSIISLFNIQEQYKENLLDNADRTAIILSKSLQKMFLSGITIENVSSIGSFLERASGVYNNAIWLAISSKDGHEFAYTSPMDNRRAFASRAYALIPGSTSEEMHLVLKVYLDWQTLLDNLFAVALDLSTLTAISTVFMLEILLLRERMRSLISDKNCAATPHLLLRPFMFFIIFAFDMTLSFIPLRMEELMGKSGAAENILSGLPVVVQTAFHFVGIIFAGILLKNFRPQRLMLLAILSLCIGYCLSMLSISPYHFVASRAFAGLGLGICLLTIKILTVGDGLLSDINIGQYSGSLCGVAMGGMLAERIGYGAVFGTASAIFMVILIGLKLLVSRLHATSANSALFDIISCAFSIERQSESYANYHSQKKLSFRHSLSILFHGRIPFFVLFVLLPLALITGSFLQFFVPLHMKTAGISQGNISRIFMLYSITIVCCGSVFDKWVKSRQDTAKIVPFPMLLGAVAVLCFAFLHPLPGAIAGTIGLGLSRTLQTSVFSQYMICLPEIQKLGTSLSMMLMESVMRMGRICSPLVIGISLALSKSGCGIVALGGILLGAAGAFYWSDRRREQAKRQG